MIKINSMGYITLLMAFLLLMSSCTTKVKKENMNGNHINLNLDKIETPQFKDIFESIEICPLETKSTSLIGNFFNMKKAFYVPNKYYVVIDDNYVVNVFNLKGEFISNSSNKIGKGPEEYYILQDITYNDINNTIDILDPFGNITVYDTNFDFISKYKIESKPKDRFRRIFALNENQYILSDNTDKGSFIIYDLDSKETIKRIEYPGLIAEVTSIESPFNFSGDKLYFTPPEVNNQLFTFDTDKMDLIPIHYINGGDKCIEKSDLDQFESLQERSEFIFRDSRKYTPINRICNEKYVISTFIKQQNIYVNIYNIENQQNRTYRKDRNINPNLPSFFAIEKDTVFAILYPADIKNFIDNDLIADKNILQTIKEDDNPCIIKYKMKL